MFAKLELSFHFHQLLTTNDRCDEKNSNVIIMYPLDMIFVSKLGSATDACTHTHMQTR